jgi:flagellar hook assembly protein FlgD
MAVIKIFDIAGVQVAELRKSDTTADHYEWNVTNNDGRKLASGVYIYSITAPGGGKAKGKFAVIR